jgi:protein-L-isoaspartate O-methyltransferase
MRDALKAGIKTVVAPQLFPTPPEIAAHMVELAEIEPGHSVLEPSAGTGNILKELPCIRPNGSITAVEIKQELCTMLEPWADQIECADFLSCNGDLGTFDRIIMNPPFENGVDIKHINHALTHLNSPGILVALCANGTRQREAFKGQAEYWEDLPDGSFKNQGTGVNVALMVLKK